MRNVDEQKVLRAFFAGGEQLRTMPRPGRKRAFPRRDVGGILDTCG